MSATGGAAAGAAILPGYRHPGIQSGFAGLSRQTLLDMHSDPARIIRTFNGEKAMVVAVGKRKPNAKGTTEKVISKPSDNTSYHCYHCKNRGHKISECRIRKKEMADKEKSSEKADEKADKKADKEKSSEKADEKADKKLIIRKPHWLHLLVHQMRQPQCLKWYVPIPMMISC